MTWKKVILLHFIWIFDNAFDKWHCTYNNRHIYHMSTDLSVTPSGHSPHCLVKGRTQELAVVSREVHRGDALGVGTLKSPQTLPCLDFPHLRHTKVPHSTFQHCMFWYLLAAESKVRSAVLYYHSVRIVWRGVLVLNLFQNRTFVSCT